MAGCDILFLFQCSVVKKDRSIPTTLKVGTLRVSKNVIIYHLDQSSLLQAVAWYSYFYFREQEYVIHGFCFICTTIHPNFENIYVTFVNFKSVVRQIRLPSGRARPTVTPCFTVLIHISAHSHESCINILQLSAGQQTLLLLCFKLFIEVSAYNAPLQLSVLHLT